MAENQVYLIKSGSNSFVEETEAVVGISGGKVGIGTTHPKADLHVTGSVKVGGDLTVDGTLTTINSNTISVDDKNIELGSTDNPTDVTADGGGITVRGTSDKTFNWSGNNSAWTSSEHLYLANGKHIATEEIRALDGDGLSIKDDAGDIAIFVEDGGQVGINKNNPKYDLDVDGSGNFTSLYVDGNAVLTGEGSIFGKWEDGTSEGEIFYTGGNVGVGTDDPEHDFHVVGDSVVDGNFAVNGESGNLNVSKFNVSGDSITLNYRGGALASDRGGLIVKDSNNASKSFEYVEGSDFWNSNVGLNITNGGLNVASVSAVDVNGLTLGDDAGNGIFVKDGGDVGIKNITPSEALDVSGSAKISADLNVVGYVEAEDLKFTTINGDSATSQNDIIAWNATNGAWEVKAASQLGLGAGGSSSEVPESIESSVTQGATQMQVSYGPFDTVPKVSATLEIDGDGPIIPFAISGVSNSSYNVIFAQQVPNSNYSIHTVFGGYDVHWRTGDDASISYTPGSVYIDKDLTVSGDLFVQGNQTIINTTKLDVEDKNITIAKNIASTDDTMVDAGITWGNDNVVKMLYSKNKGFSFNGGNVGIGTTNPGTNKLDVQGTLSVGATATSTSAGYIKLQGYRNASDQGVLGHVRFDNQNEGNTAGKIEVYAGGSTTTGTMRFHTSGSEKMRIAANGNVGIGTTIPSLAKLQIEGDNDLLRLTSTRSGAGGAEITLVQNSDSPANEDAHGMINFVGNDTDNANPLSKTFSSIRGITHDALNSKGRIGLFTRNGGAFEEALSVTAGLVGIGHTNPGGKLHVSDLNVSIGSVTVTDDGGDPPVVSTQITGTDLNTKISDGDRIKINGEIFTVSDVQPTTLTLSGTPSTADTFTAYTDSNGLIVTSAGKVGIGTTNPGKQLHIAANAHHIALEDTNGTVGSKMVGIFNNNQQLHLGRYSDDNFNDFTTDLFINATGNVGIGTTSTAKKLDVNTWGRKAPGTAIIVSGNATALTTEDMSSIISVGDTVVLANNNGTSDTSNKVFTVSSVATDSVTFTPTPTFSATLHVFLLESTFNVGSGRVGIGTTNPGYKLDVHENSDTGWGARIINDSTANEASGLIVRCNGGSSGDAFRVHSSSEEFLRVKNNGNVGIGTTDPGEKLHIEGSSPSIKIKATNQAGLAEIKLQTDAGDQNDDLWSIRASNHQPADSHLLEFMSYSTGELVSALAIKSNGNVGIGTTNPISKLSIHTSGATAKGLQVGTDNGAADSIRTVGGGGDDDIKFVVKGSGNINANGALASFGPGTASETTGVNYHANNSVSYNLLKLENTSVIMNVAGNGDVSINGTVEFSSDDRVKHNEQNIVGAIETLGKLTPKKYIKTTEMYEANHDFELDADGNPVDADGAPVEHRIEAGVIAQQVLTVDELAFAVSPEGVDEDGNVTSPHGLNYNSLFTYAIAAIQEQQSIIEDLKSQNASLESRISALES